LRAVIEWQEENGYPLTFITEASLDLADDEELIELMDLANIRSVFLGIETPNENALKETKKMQNLRGHNRSIPEKVAAIQAHGIEVWSGMMLGFDTDTPDIFERQIRLVEEAKIVHSSVGMVTAIPKTPLYDRMLKADRLDLADRTPFGTNIVPVAMRREELRDGSACCGDCTVRTSSSSGWTRSISIVVSARASCARTRRSRSRSGTH
jgi:radical SAM superfamily enzyme YgiQ (UPF0313 family)